MGIKNQMAILKCMETMISKVNANEIADQIKFNGLSKWCLSWQCDMNTLLCSLKRDLEATELTAALKGE